VFCTTSDFNIDSTQLTKILCFGKRQTRHRRHFDNHCRAFINRHPMHTPFPQQPSYLDVPDAMCLKCNHTVLICEGCHAPMDCSMKSTTGVHAPMSILRPMMNLITQIFSFTAGVAQLANPQLRNCCRALEVSIPTHPVALYKGKKKTSCRRIPITRNA
jgi:hypothetical protein